MPGRNKEPINLIMAKEKKHLTKAEIEERKKQEIKVNAVNVKSPEYLNEKQKQEFERIAKILLDIGIMTELDEDRLAQYLITMEEYIEYTEKIRSLKEKLKRVKKKETKKECMSMLDSYLKYQSRALKQSRECASDLGLSISSRCKLVMPKTNESPKKNKFNKFRKRVG